MIDKSEVLKETLSKSELHNTWVSRYYSGRNNKFYELAFDFIVSQIEKPAGKCFLDAGCGNGAHSIRLAKRGLKVYAADFSDEALKLCKRNVENNELKKSISVNKENLLSLSADSSQFDGALCWGVLMHIAEIEKALDELCRVIKPGGYLVLCENSMHSFENILRTVVKKIINKKNTLDIKAPRGIECWYETEAGKFLVRKTNMKWLKSYTEKNSMRLVSHTSGQFTELYSWVNFRPLKISIQLFNEFWFKYVKHPGPSLANILIFRKDS